jgi:ubiquinone/menaquinone biosynthesis C-methylase UbiE
MKDYIKLAEQTYDGAFGNTYDAAHPSSRLFSVLNIKRLNALPSQINTILEIGCGTGHLTVILYQVFPQARIYALDVSQNMLDILREKLHPADLKRTEFIKSDAEKYLRNTEQYFDLICMSGVLHHMENWREILQLISRKTDCIYLALEPKKIQFISIKSILFKALNHLDKHNAWKLSKIIDASEPPIGGFSPKEIKEMLNDFEITIFPGAYFRNTALYHLANILSIDTHFCLIGVK